MMRRVVSTPSNGALVGGIAQNLTALDCTASSNSSPTQHTFQLQRRSKISTSTAINYVREMMFDNDMTDKMNYYRKRQQDAIEFAEKEREYFESKAVKAIEEARRKEAIDEAEIRHRTGEATPEEKAALEELKMMDGITPGNSYVKSVDAFGDKSVKLMHTFIGSADNRVIQWWENIWWNYIKYIVTKEVLIAKDRYGTKFTVMWNHNRARNESRYSYRVDRNKRHQPYGALHTDDRIWARWMRGHRGQPPTIAEEEYMRKYKKQAMGPNVVGEEEVEDAVIRHIAQLGRSSDLLQELDDEHDYDDSIRRTQPQRDKDRNPEEEQRDRAKKGATWTMGFVRGDLFYNEEETQVMRTEMGHVFRNMEWQDLEYKRQVRKFKAQKPVGKPETNDPRDGDGDPQRHQWERTDLGIPHYDAVPDLSTPEMERLRIENDQLEDERIAIRKELGLTDLGDIREGRDPIDKGYAPFQPPPVSSRWKPKCWEESWGTGGGHRW